jgi:galactose mutarotase-like enzyme
MLKTGTVHGHSALWLENEYLRVGVLPHKGADIFEFTWLPAGVQLLMQTPAGLKPPGKNLPTEFLENYEGGWQELFPNHGDGCEYRGQVLPMHGETALLPWQYQVLKDDGQGTTVHLEVACRKTPFRVERSMHLGKGETRLEIEGRVTNQSDQPTDFVWGHHLTLGEDFLQGDSRLEVPAGMIQTPDQLYETKTARLAPGQKSPWPAAVGRNGEKIDASIIPGRQIHSHDDAFLTGLERGHFSLTSRRRGLCFSLDWDAQLFPWIAFWQPFGGAELPPLTGIYGIGIEPWVSQYSLDQAVAKGEARRLAGGQSLATKLVASITEI